VNPPPLQTRRNPIRHIMLTLECISFNTSGWTPEEAAEDLIVWTNEAHDRMEYRIAKKPPRLPSLYPLEGIQKFASQRWNNETTAIISVDVLTIRGMSIVRSVLKRKIGDSHVSYHGRIHIPFRDFAFEIKIKTAPVAAPSDRESQLRAEHENNEDATLPWEQDPYLPDHRSDFLCCESDNGDYDDRFPEDPLTLLRQELVKIVSSIVTIREVRNAVPFQGNIPA